MVSSCDWSLWELLVASRISHNLNLSLTGLCKGAKLREPLNVKLIWFVSGNCSFECVMSKSMAHACWKKQKTGEKISGSVISSAECGIRWCQKLHTFLSACDTRRNHIIWIKCHIVLWSSTLFMSQLRGDKICATRIPGSVYMGPCVLWHSGSFGNTLSEVWAAGSQGPWLLLLLQDSLQNWQ